MACATRWVSSGMGGIAVRLSDIRGLLLARLSPGFDSCLPLYPRRLVGRTRLRLAQTPLRQRYPYTPQTKGKVERTVGVLKAGFWPGVRFTDLDDLNQQTLAWCERLNGQPHATTRVAPCVRWAEERLRPLPTDWAWERFAAEERRVSRDRSVSYDGVLYRLPAARPGHPPLVGATVQVRDRAGQLAIWSGGDRILVVPNPT